VRLAAAILLVAAIPVLTAQRAADPLTKARQAYNNQQYDLAIQFSKEAKNTPSMADSAGLVFSRAMLERFRRTGDPVDLEQARNALLAVNPSRLNQGESSELHLGMAELMFVDDQFGTATEMFEVALDRPGMVPDALRDRVLEWWAASLDRHAQLSPDTQRMAKYWRMLTRLETEAARGPNSPAVAYWMAAAARGVDDPDRAWSLAIAAWIQAPMIAGARAAALRTDIDRLMDVAIIPERANRSAADADIEALKLAYAAEWKAIKAKWVR
jgi:hypothetical protein